MVTLNDARRIIAAAEKKASELGQPMNIAVADAGGNLIAHVRMDGAWLGSIDISIKKAYTSGLSILLPRTWLRTASLAGSSSEFTPPMMAALWSLLAVFLWSKTARWWVLSASAAVPESKTMQWLKLGPLRYKERWIRWLWRAMKPGQCSADGPIFPE
jgi:uncharacterized protein GlcG (DUF336 family)